jgi:hypothetical protein
MDRAVTIESPVSLTSSLIIYHLYGTKISWVRDRRNNDLAVTSTTSHADLLFQEEAALHEASCACVNKLLLLLYMQNSTQLCKAVRDSKGDASVIERVTLIVTEQTCLLALFFHYICLPELPPPWAIGLSFFLLFQRSRVRFPALPVFF